MDHRKGEMLLREWALIKDCGAGQRRTQPPSWYQQKARTAPIV